ncbi:hypothetical protein KBB96_13005 [Luteolibacter ambystomatis]|uniref:Uncharacterized protein n=1 Tax=Luteolibacter ambystomatis TaxID=2824561 RepID=A0A975G6C9_9BACT|nr:hypothetical protein [Luteolibacter ambystomatis]QUE49788.1 hypothetical protein KBB96_13005 [Luteolibacter ambystomatis]
MSAPVFFAKKYRRARVRGFSLVITLMMMMLLSILALGLLSLSTITLRASSQGTAQSVARSNARLALVMALGQLQTLAGPDTRATAPAAQQEVEASAGGKAQGQQVAQPHWIGVWPTTVTGNGNAGFVVGRYGADSEKKNYLVDLRNASTPSSGSSTFDASRTEFGSKGQLGWLVSADPSMILDPKTFESSEDKTRVVFGSQWASSGDPEQKKKAVSVPVVSVKAGEDQKGGYAYWVSDESEKANIAIEDRQTPGSQNSLAVSQISAADNVDSGFNGHGELARGPASVVKNVSTLNTAALLPLSGKSEDLAKKIRELGHDLTATSVGLLTNPQTGGYQQDLSAFLARQETITETTTLGSASSGFTPDSSIGTPGLSIGSPLVYGARHSATSPRFGALKAWADLAAQVSGQGGGAQIKASLPPYTTTHPYKGPDLTRVAAQAIQPIMTEFSVGFDFTPFSTAQAGRDASKDGLRLHIYPRVVLWNPYNVAINAPSYLAIVRYDPRVSLKMRGVALETPFYTKKSSSHGYYPYLLSMVEDDETITNNCLGFTTEATVIPAGQALVFTPDVAKGTSKIGGTAVKYDARRIETNILTCRNPISSPGGQENFYGEAPIRPGGDNTLHFSGIPKAGTTDYSWSYVNDVGMFYQLKQLPAGVSNLTVPAAGNYETIQYVVPNAWGTNYKTYEGLKDGTNSEGQPFQEYGLSATRHQQSTWRVGVRVRWFDETNEWAARTNNGALFMGRIPFVSAWSQYNLRGGHVHTAWLGSNVNYSEADPGKAYEWNPGGNYINIRNNLSNDDTRMMASPNDAGQFTIPPFGNSSDLGGVQSFVFYEVPQSDTPVASLAQFQNAQLSYANYQPGNVVGWSFQDVRSERGATVVRPGRAGSADVGGADDISQPKRWNVGHEGLIQKGSGHADDILLYDMAFEVNNRLFDNYYLSTIPYSSSGSSWNLQTVLPNGRLRPIFAKTEKSARISLGALDTAFNKSASLLGNCGAFNVNSTSEAAWIAHLSGLRGLKRDTSGGSASGSSPFSRMQHPTAVNGEPSSWIDPSTWSGSRGLNDDEIRQLAKAMVQEVKLRGPFLSLSDFVNRRLVDAPASANSALKEDSESNTLEATGRYGALDGAIRRANLNKNLQAGGTSDLASCEQAFNGDDLTKGYIPYGAQPDYKTIGLPGYLTQGDILSVLAPTLTARGDTFLVRSYGEARDKDGKVTASAWCEAVVQRTPDYMDSRNESATRELVPGSSDPTDPTVVENGKLTTLNKKFGRRFELVSFRWLKSSEV